MSRLVDFVRTVNPAGFKIVLESWQSSEGQGFLLGAMQRLRIR